MKIRERILQYAFLIRLDKPIGTLLLLWPTLWAMWLAQQGRPAFDILFIFIAGTFLMRSAGCAINDFADRNFDGQIARTRQRPLASKKILPIEALIIAALLSLIAFLLVLHCNRFTIELAFVGAFLAAAYPFLKRVTHLPQLGLGLAFTWGVPMAFAAICNSIPLAAWVLFLTGLIWPIIYDTMYAMVDREEDKKVGIKSSAILFDQMDTFIIALLQVLFLVMLVVVGIMFRLHVIYLISLIIVALLFGYQQWLLKTGEAKKCFAAFLNNNWVGFVIFLGIYLSYQ